MFSRRYNNYFLALSILLLFFPNLAWASTAQSSVETEVQAGNAEVYQSVETTVNGVTVKKESRQPGKLELKMEQTASSSPTVTFTQEPFSPSPTPTTNKNSSTFSFVTSITEFFKELFNNLSSLFRV